MKNIILTSTGFDNENIKNKFIELLDDHCDKGNNKGIIDFNDDTYLTENQVIYINSKEKIIFE